MNKTKIFYIIQICITICLCAFILRMLLADYAKDVDLDTVQTAVSKDCTGLDELNLGTAQNVKKNIGISPSDYDWVLYYYGGGAMNVDEFLIVKTDNDDAMEAAVAGAESRLATQITNFTNYGTNQIELLNGAVSYQIGDYYFFCVSENASQWKEVFEGLIR